MGYRSNVAIKCQKGAYRKISSNKEILEYDKLLTDGQEYIMIWDYVKWYDDYPEVIAIDCILKELDSIEDAYDKGMAYKFIRLGESDGDVEERTNSYDIDFYYLREFDTGNFTQIIVPKAPENSMDNIYLITLNSNGEQIERQTTVEELVKEWKQEEITDIPTNDDPVVSCLLGSTQLYIEDFGELMGILTGNK